MKMGEEGARSVPGLVGFGASVEGEPSGMRSLLRGAVSWVAFGLLGWGLMGSVSACSVNIFPCEKEGACGGTSGKDGLGGDSPGGGSGGSVPEQQGCQPACNGDTPYCVEEEKKCVGCLSSEHCAEEGTFSAQPVCSAGECVACSDAAECEALSAGALKQCLPSGACVECVSEADCGGFICDTKTNRCTEKGPKVLDWCGACEYDEECQEGQFCVEMRYDAPTPNQVVGKFCLQDRLQLRAQDCGNKRPYVKLLQEVRNSRGDLVDVCSPSTTCAGLMGHGQVCEKHEDCGAEGFNDAHCDSQQFRCTYACDGEMDCWPVNSCRLATRTCFL